MLYELFCENLKNINIVLIFMQRIIAESFIAIITG
jgi:hypothetical protein